MFYVHIHFQSKIKTLFYLCVILEYVGKYMAFIKNCQGKTISIKK